jgi:ABC-type nitrate/sulfonate/bicarbonate transport system permease component
MLSPAPFVFEEQSLTRFGPGYDIVVETYQVLLYLQMYAGILAMSLLGVLLDFGVYLVDRNVNKHLQGGGKD